MDRSVDTNPIKRGGPRPPWIGHTPCPLAHVKSLSEPDPYSFAANASGHSEWSDYALPSGGLSLQQCAGSRVLLIVNRRDISGRLDCPPCITGDTLRVWLMCRFESYATTAVRSLIAWPVVNA